MPKPLHPLLCSMGIFLLLCSGLGLAQENAKPVQDVVIRQSLIADINNEDYYFYRLLQLVLDKTEREWGKAQIKMLPYRLEDKRLRMELSNGTVDVLWSPISTKFEEKLLPVRISLLKELNNYRILLIRNGDQARFSDVKSLDDLRKFRGGMSSQWTDAEIMEYNRLPLVLAVGYGKLFKMLAANRFDYFSRGLYQIQSEVNFYPELELKIERKLMLAYPNPVYFFVNKNDTALERRLTEGLEIALSDGSFDALFHSIPRYQWGIEQLKNSKRRVIELQPLPVPSTADDHN